MFRVGRKTEPTYPVGSSISDAGMSTPRAISFNKVGKELVGRSGQTSTQIVIMTDPPESYTIVPLGVMITRKAAIGMTRRKNCSCQ